MNEVIDIQDAFDALAQHNAELTFAFYGFASLVSGSLTSGRTFTAEELADEYGYLAEHAGQQLASASGEEARPNPHLAFLAATLREVTNPVKLTALDGGKTDPGHLDQ